LPFAKGFITAGVYVHPSGFSLAVPARYRLRTVLPLCLPRHGRPFGDEPRTGARTRPTAAATPTTRG